MAAKRQYYDLHGIAMIEEAFERMISVESPHSGHCKVACRNRKFTDRRAH